MLCKFCVKLVRTPGKIFLLVFEFYSFQALKLGSARDYCLIVGFSERRSGTFKHAVNGCIFLNHLNKYGIFLLARGFALIYG